MTQRTHCLTVEIPIFYSHRYQNQNHTGVSQFTASITKLSSTSIDIHTMPPITLWFLQASRSIRTAWLLEELGLDYTVKFSERINQKAPPEFKAASGNPLGKFPTLQDGDLTICESGAINEYVVCHFSISVHFMTTRRKSSI